LPPGNPDEPSAAKMHAMTIPGIRRTGLCVLQAALLALVAPGFAHPQSCIDYAGHFHWISSVDVPGYKTSLAVAGNLLCSMDHDGLAVIDVTDPRAPRYAGRNNVGRGIMTAAGSFAYVASGTVLSVIDLADLPALAIRGSTALPQECSALTILGSHLFAACGSTLQSIDVTDPSHPTIVGFGSTRGPAVDMAAQDSLVFLLHADILQGHEVIDVSDPLHPESLGRFYGTPATDIEVLGGHAYVLTNTALLVIDVSDPRAPILTGSVGVQAGRLAVAGHTAYLSGRQWPGIVIMVDVESPALPRIIGQSRIPVAANHIVAAGTNLYVEVSFSIDMSEIFAIEIFDIAAPEPPPIIARILIPACDVSTAGDLLFCMLNSQLPYAQVSLFDITDASAPRALGIIDLPVRPNAVAMTGNIACFADGPAGIEIYDLTNRDAPRHLQRIFTPGEANDVAVLGTHAYVMDSSSGMWIVDVANPGAARVDTIIQVPRGSTSIEIAHGRAYIGTGQDGVLVFDLANPVAPTVLGSVPARGPFAVSETMLASVDGSGTFSLYDVSDPGASAFLGAVQTPYLELPYTTFELTLAMTARHVYAIGGNLGMHVVDISNPRSPRVVGEFDPLGSDNGLAIAGGRVFLAGCDAVSILPAACETTTPVLLHDLEAEAMPDGVRLHWIGDTTNRARFAITRSRGSQPDDGEYHTLENVGIWSDGVIHAALDRDVEPATTYSYRIAAQFASGEYAEIGPVVVTTRELRFGLQLLGPSPMHDHTALGLDLPLEMPVDLSVYDVAGRLVRCLRCCGTLPAGRHIVTWDGHNTNGRRVANGVYLAALQSGKSITIQRIPVVR
jgi:hypothetical protein